MLSSRDTPTRTAKETGRGKETAAARGWAATRGEAGLLARWCDFVWLGGFMISSSSSGARVIWFFDRGLWLLVSQLPSLGGSPRSPKIQLILVLFAAHVIGAG